jgi:hypothetical protein
LPVPTQPSPTPLPPSSPEILSPLTKRTRKQRNELEFFENSRMIAIYSSQLCPARLHRHRLHRSYLRHCPPRLSRSHQFHWRLNWLRPYQTSRCRLHCQHRPTHGITPSSGHIGSACCTGHATFAHAIFSASSPRAFKADAITIPAIPMATAAENTILRRLGTIFALSKALSSQKILSLLVL